MNVDSLYPTRRPGWAAYGAEKRGDRDASSGQFAFYLGLVLLGQLICGLIATGLPMAAGLRAFRKMEF